jgi:hypothetical protein
MVIQMDATLMVTGPTWHWDFPALNEALNSKIMQNGGLSTVDYRRVCTKYLLRRAGESIPSFSCW